MSKESNVEKTPKRILGDLRIFQAVFADASMRHEIVTLEDGTRRYAYVYEGADPYQLEDTAFPLFVGLVEALIASEKLSLLEKIKSDVKFTWPKGYATSPEIDGKQLLELINSEIATLTQEKNK